MEAHYWSRIDGKDGFTRMELWHETRDARSIELVKPKWLRMCVWVGVLVFRRKRFVQDAADALQKRF